MSVPLTIDQERAASDRGGARLVSAAAGSGKTRVLVERLMRYVDDGYDIDRFLVVTFTRAAAGEMRSRILSALNQRLAARPGDRRLRRQTELCARAPIGTIDGICGRILRVHAHAAGIAPDFRVLETDRADALLSAALDDALEEFYGGLDADPARRELADSFGAGRDDRALSELVVKVHSAVQSHPHPETWLRSMKEALSTQGVADVGKTRWGSVVLGSIAARAEYRAGRLDALTEALAEPGREKIRKACADRLAEAASGFRALASAAGRGWEAARSVTVNFPTMGSYKKEADPIAESISSFWDDCKNDFRKRITPLLADDSAVLLEGIEATRPALEALLGLTARLGVLYSERKRRQGAVDFSDQEHLVLDLLEDSSNGLAAELSARYAEVLVDEYQDVNDCQDTLFRLLSDGGKKLFMVGDVKQSIYRFRLADPGIFLKKYNSWPSAAETLPDGEPGKLLLRENFRSRGAVLTAVNHVFANLMSPRLGELTYDDAAALRVGTEAQEGGENVVLTMIDMSSDPDSEDEESPDKATKEACHIADRIRALVDGGIEITDGDGNRRPVRYGDIAILLRSNKSVSERFRAALETRSVPARTQQGGGFFRSPEITVLLSLLAVIDNPRQDVALISALRSPLWGFTADDLADIRRYNKNSDFYTALTLAAAERPDLAAFLTELEEYRSVASDLSVEALLGRICEKRDLYALLSAMPDGDLRKENVRALIGFARDFEQDGYRGLFRFLARMKRLADSYDEPVTGGAEQSDAVQIISIHHSKGLEYPIVFLASVTHRFNTRDTGAAVLTDPKLGVAGKLVDHRRGVRCPTLAWTAVRDVTSAKALSEELRVLYVAMTRAKERLYISGTWPDAQKDMKRKGEGLCSPLPPELLLTDKSMGDWLLRTVLLPSSPIELEIVKASDIPDAGPALPAPPEPLSEEPEDAPAALWPDYPMAWAASLPGKLTASGLEGTEPPDGDAAELAPAVKRSASPRRPRLGGGETPLTAAERGTAVHTALQFLDYARCGTLEDIRGETERLRAEGRLSEAQAKAVDPEMIRNFFRSEIGRRVLSAEKVWRELRFSLLAEAELFFDVPSGERVLLQGVVDCCILEDGALTVVDYKTDYVTPETLAAKTAEYTPQLRAYALALERILGLPVREGVLFFLRAGRESRVSLGSR